MNRRAFLATTAGISLTTAGCLDRLPSSQSLSGRTLEEPIFNDNEERWQDSPFEADVFSTPEEAKDALNTGIEPYEHRLEETINFDPDSQFLAVCASTREFTPQGNLKGWCPRREIDGDTFVFRFPFEEWPSELEDPYVNRVILNVWNRNMTSPPTHAAVEVQFLDDDEDIRTCSD
ncbi:hypothetical protein [Natrialba swarupiae]|uniref:Uncharacterized protein n=1 Tax=Natrialba swarupiae TaxID=2448032 RepID=A0A5D5ARS4_9EURY|nr:hypothetical protein [Natrialba swarupiae]TYT61761.1 hypothetical protein FYC77_12105 [Natrialba swarupiae]